MSLALDKKVKGKHKSTIIGRYPPNLYGSGFSIAVGVVSPPPIDCQKRPETISFEVRSIEIDQKRSV